MLDELKSQLQEVIAISEECPVPFREKCFEILWGHVVRASLGSEENAMPNKEVRRSDATHNGKESTDQFLNQYSIAEEDWLKVFHRDGESWTIIAPGLKETAHSKSQVKIALLIGAASERDQRGGIVDRQELINACTKYGVYDNKNFSTHMKKQVSLFVPRENDWELTRPAMTTAAEAIKELAG